MAVSQEILMQGILMLWHTSCSTHGADLPVLCVAKVLTSMSHDTELAFLHLVFVARPSKACHISNSSVHTCFSLSTEGLKHETKALSEQAY